MPLTRVELLTAIRRLNTAIELEKSLPPSTLKFIRLSMLFYTKNSIQKVLEKLAS